MGADLEARSDTRRTALMLSAEKGHEAVVRHLVQHGANMMAKDRNGRTALQGAVSNQHGVVAQLLLDNLVPEAPSQWQLQRGYGSGPTYELGAGVVKPDSRMPELDATKLLSCSRQVSDVPMHGLSDPMNSSVRVELPADELMRSPSSITRRMAGLSDPMNMAHKALSSAHTRARIRPFNAPQYAQEASAKDQDVGVGVRSVLLEEFRSNSKSNKRYELKDIYNHVVEFSGDQHGSRFIQQKLETANSDEKEQLFREIQPNALQLMTDVFGNYVIQKLFEHGNQVQKRVLAEQMKNHVMELSMQMYSCRVVQKVSNDDP
jgi:hypothetical protein